VHVTGLVLRGTVARRRPHAGGHRDLNPLGHVVSGPRAFFDGDYGSGTAWWGAGPTVAMGVAGWWFGVLRFRQESSGRTSPHLSPVGVSDRTICRS
jgi:hypothetical protein